MTSKARILAAPVAELTVVGALMFLGCLRAPASAEQSRRAAAARAALAAAPTLPNRSPDREVCFGETHVCTSRSFDAGRK